MVLLQAENAQPVIPAAGATSVPRSIYEYAT
jgi:hypothetical protein